MKPLPNIAARQFSIAAALSLVLLAAAQARTWTSADGTKTFEGELHSYDVATGKVAVKLPNGRQMNFAQDKLLMPTSHSLRKTARWRRHPRHRPEA